VKIKKKHLIIFALLVVIAGLTAITNLRFKNWQNNFNGGSFLEPLRLNVDEIQKISSIEETSLKKFSSPDGNLIVDYPADWVAIEQPEIIQAMSPEDWKEKYNLQTLLFALKTNDESAQLVAYKGTFGLTTEEIIEEIKKTTQDQGWKMNIVSSEVKEKKAVFEAEYETSSGALFHSKEKVLIAEDEAYLITALVSETSWQETKDDIDKIINSATIIK